MTRAQKPDFVFRRNGRVCLNRLGRQFSRLMAAEVCASAVVMLDKPCSEVVKGTDYPLHSPVSPSLPLPCAIVCHHVSTGVYKQAIHSVTSLLRCGHSRRQLYMWRCRLTKSGCTSCMLRPCAPHEGIGRSRRITPLILKLGTRRRST